MLQGQCFHSYDDKCEAEAGMRAEGNRIGRSWLGRGGSSIMCSGREELGRHSYECSLRYVGGHLPREGLQSRLCETKFQRRIGTIVDDRQDRSRLAG